MIIPWRLKCRFFLGEKRSKRRHNLDDFVSDGELPNKDGRSSRGQTTGQGQGFSRGKLSKVGAG